MNEIIITSHFWDVNLFIPFLAYNIGMKVFSERLKELRIEKGLSIQALAKQTGLSSSSLCRWENNQAEIKASEIVVIAKFFGVTADFLLGLEN